MADYATYSAEDNKLRFYPAARLSQDDYLAMKAAEFKWAPKQECFMAAQWTPAREDFLLTLVDWIEDEDITMVERAAVRAERFRNYSEKRAGEAETAYNQVQQITSNIPFGQPILVGHHSEKRARKDAEKIERGIQKTIKLHETSEYWQYRAKASENYAKFKNRPDVRWRRRKGLEAEARKYERELEIQRQRHLFFSREDLTEELVAKAFYVGEMQLYDGMNRWTEWDDENRKYRLKNSLTQTLEQIFKSIDHNVKHYTRWLNHTNERIAYETEMLEGWEPQKVERLKRELSPLVNFPSEDCIEMTAAQWKQHSKYDIYQCEAFNADGTRAPWRTPGAYRRRMRSLGFLNGKNTPIFVTDMPVKYPPKQEQQVDVG
jgi:hypothetical protein